MMRSAFELISGNLPTSERKSHPVRTFEADEVEVAIETSEIEVFAVAWSTQGAHRIRPVTASRGPEYVVGPPGRRAGALRAIDGLRAEDRELIVLVDWEEVPRAEIASMSGISRKAVCEEQSLSRA